MFILSYVSNLLEILYRSFTLMYIKTIQMLFLQHHL